MARIVREVEERTYRDGDEVASLSDAEERERSMSAIGRIIYFIGGVIMSIIGIRIILSLLGANRENAFAEFIYGVSYPFVAPFFGLFNYDMQYGVSRFEFESLIALIVWGLLAAAIAQLFSIVTRRPID